jgi:hypothetical protein
MPGTLSVKGGLRHVQRRKKELFIDTINDIRIMMSNQGKKHGSHPGEPGLREGIQVGST